MDADLSRAVKCPLCLGSGQVSCTVSNTGTTGRDCVECERTGVVTAARALGLKAEREHELAARTATYASVRSAVNRLESLYGLPAYDPEESGKGET